jgi:DNA-binding transcriptional ArsR family regulator
LSLAWVSAAEAPRYVEIVTAFTEKIQSLGPLGVSEGLEREVLTFKLKAAKTLSEQEKFRWILGKKTEFSKEGNVYGEVFTRHELNRLLQGLITEDLKVHEILQLLETRSLSVKEVAQRLGLSPKLVLKHITALRRRKLVDLKGIKEGSPRYTLYQKEGEKRNGC